MRRYLAITLCICAALSISCKNEVAKEKKVVKPNVLFILADDLGYHDLSFAGSKYYETPNIDKLASQSAIFDNGYAACQVCSPSRASIMSGKFPARHGITDWIGARSGETWREKNRHTKLLPAEYEHVLNKDFVTLPEALKEEGYKTFFAGKWHLGDKGSWPEDHGFDINIGGFDAGGPRGGYYGPFNNPKLENKKDGENLSMRLASETVNFLSKNNPNQTGQPVFAFLSFYAVHGPIQTTQEKWSKYRAKAEKQGIPENGFEMRNRLPMRVVQDNPVYGGLVETMDDAVGSVLKSLKTLGLDENTIVIFTSDNGGVSAGDSFSTSNLPLNGGKGYQFEGGIREPYLLKIPNVTKGEVISEPVSSTDFYPTLLDLIGGEQRPQEHQDGVSLKPLLSGGKLSERALIWHYPHYGNQGGDPSGIIRRGDWKLIHYYEDGKEELYNLKSDLSEKNNVASNNPERVKKLSAELFTYLKNVNAKFPTKDPLYDVQKEAEVFKKNATKLLKNREKERKKYLNPDFDPKNNWWGSKVTND
ncbi:sulfatase [Postechiella marina]|uniref:Sulfatase n=1 Tax=Postechiella marina TaxID=943941 RepID=A0ABP8CDE2_9FLAO